MKKEYREAFSEINEIFKLMPRELTNKIPNEFKIIIEEEKSKEYFPIIQEPIENVILKKETIILLGIIYRDFLCSPEEKKQLYAKEKTEFETMQKEFEEVKEKINYNDILKNISTQKDNTIKEEKQENQLVTTEEKRWYHKIFDLIKRIFK